ncbi:ribonuclease HI [Virgibacillus natechei]|uniref:Ribonuclease HI n=1 Tax=Virgibacillus natechei TaxID=1216297 RepID=A0ABS4IH15_9BACI|nr:ribonuclease H family protein [Virgibacillus natechei]MBP1970234.1 ribonuclease HI [Virgibacillus natechei]UZD12818.1 ribonuclease H family protein [Virgibacillus natechei]
MEVRIEFMYQTPKGLGTTFSSDVMAAEEAIVIADDLNKTGRTKHVAFIDSYGNTWTLKELKKMMEEIQTEPHNVMVYFDGGFDPKTKKSGLGCVIYYEQNNKSFRLRRNALIEEMDNNNEAEYAAIHLGVQELECLGVHHIAVTFAGDSKVVINQLDEEWVCYEDSLLKWIERIERKLDRLGINPTYKRIPRKNNQEADQLASQSLNGIEIISTKEQ